MIDFAPMNPISMLKEKQGDRSIRQFAKKIGCSHAYLAYVMKGERPPGPKILKYLGLQKIKLKPIKRRPIYDWADLP